MPSFVKQLVPPLLVNLLKRARQALGRPTDYKYKNFSIRLPGGHMLPAYQRQYPKYDRFLPRLAPYLGEGGVVDVGANCGDTLAGMVESNPRSTYLCIEADDSFYGYLESNVQRMRAAIPGIRVHTVQSLVGKGVSAVSLDGLGGTKHAVAGDSKSARVTFRTLDSILSEAPVKNISLLKSDVDGFDYDVIASAEALLRRQQPLVFFECQYDSPSQREGYEKTIRWLETIGYRDWTLFDNFGELCLRTGDVGQVFQLLDYVWRQNTKKAARTIYYYDILAATERLAPIVSQALKEY